MQLLSKKGVLFLTSGFNQSYAFQNIACFIQNSIHSKDGRKLKIILSDGEMYISAIYLLQNKSFSEIQKCQKIREFDILRIKALYNGANKPILIQSLEILSQNHEGLYGQIPISIYDYLQGKMIKNSTSNTQNCRFYNSNVEKSETNPDNINLNKNQFKCSNQIQIDNKNQNFQKQKQEQLKQLIVFSQSQEKEEEQFLNAIAKNQKQKREELIPNQKQKDEKATQNQQHKREERTQIQEKTVNIPQKKVKPNEDQIQFQIRKNFQMKQTQKNSQISQIKFRNSNINHKFDLQNTQTQQFNVIEVDVIDLDDMTTQREQISYFQNSNKKENRRSNLKSLQAIFEIGEKSQQLQIEIDEITIPKSQTLNELNQTQITPKKRDQLIDSTTSLSKSRIGTTTSRKKLKQQYNLLISNLYEDNNSFKILCRVNHLYQWRSKNGTPCVGVQLMDLDGYQIKAIIYMNHSSKQCKDCYNAIEVGKVYCFQNGQCKRNQYEKNQLELIFNLRTKNHFGSESCNGKGKIILANKIIVDPIFQARLMSIEQAVQNFNIQKNYLINTYGILDNFKTSEYQFNRNFINPVNEENSAELANNQQIDLQKQNQKQKQKKFQANEGYKKLYIHGSLVDVISKKQILFNLMIPKPVNEFDITSECFLERNLIKKGSLIILHNMKIKSTNNNTVKKLEKTKNSYIQVISERESPFSYEKNEFAAETISIKDKQEHIYSAFQQIITLSQDQIQQIIKNPRFVNYSQQPYTSRNIKEMNQILQNHVMADDYCHTELHDAKIHSIQQHPAVQICEFCKKKIKSQPMSSKSMKLCTKCKKIVKPIKMHIFHIIFADNSASFFVQVLKDAFIQTILGISIRQYTEFSENQRKYFLDHIKYNQFNLKIRSEKKIGGVTHKITTIERMPVDSKIHQIKCQRKGVQKHFKKLESSW